MLTGRLIAIAGMIACVALPLFGAMACYDEGCAADARWQAELRRTATEDAEREDTGPYWRLGRGEAALHRGDN
jgi:hypothetical protein